MEKKIGFVCHIAVLTNCSLSEKKIHQQQMFEHTKLHQAERSAYECKTKDAARCPDDMSDKFLAPHKVFVYICTQPWKHLTHNRLACLKGGSMYSDCRSYAMG